MVFWLLFSVFSCKKKKIEDPPDVGYDYAPTNIGKYIVYDVDSTVYDDFFNDTTYNKYRIKELLQDEFVDNEGRPAIKMVRYIKKFNPAVSYDNMPWSIKDIWTVIKTNTTYEVVEEDVRLTKLVFPVKTETTWKGNAYTSLPDWDYEYIYTDSPETINGTSFENVLYVQQKDDKNKNVIHREFYIEKYAKNVGLVYREIKDLKSNDHIVIGQPVENRIKSGVIYKQTYVTHGRE